MKTWYFLYELLLITSLILGLIKARFNLFSILGLLILIVSIIIILTWEIKWKKTKGIITKGIYSKVRHPFLSGLLLAFFSIPIIFNSFPTLLIAFISYIIIFLGTIKEEKELIKQYPKYKQYLKKVPYRFVPHII